MSEEIRREFEEWALSRGLSTKKLLPVSEIYYMESMQRAWEAWQAARNQRHSDELHDQTIITGTTPES